MLHHRGSRQRLIVLGCISMAFLVGGCGDDQDNAATPASSTAEADAAVRALYTGTDGKPPEVGPPANTGRNVWVISCGEAAEGCATATRNMKEAGKVLGWDVTLFDGNFDVEGAYSRGVRQAVAAGADGIVLAGTGCDPLKQALKEAHEAGTTIVGASSYDCHDDPQFDSSVVPNKENPTTEEFNQAWGRAKASWLVSNFKGEGKILDFTVPGDPGVVDISKGFSEVTDACTACEVRTIEVSPGDAFSDAFAQRVDDALLKNPDAAAIHAPFDSMILLGVPGALKRSGRDDVLVVGGEGNHPNLALIRSGAGQSAAIAYDLGWPSWAAMDTMNRLFSNKKPAPAGYGFTAVDAKHNLPEGETGFRSSVDFRAAYEAVWSGQ